MKYHFQNENGEHYHWLDDKRLTGTSSVIDVLNKPLTWWAAGKALEALGWTNPNPKNAAYVSREEGIKIAGKARAKMFITNEQYYDWLQECYRAHDTRKKEAAVKGTDLHAELERFVKYKMGKLPLQLHDSKINPFIAWCDANVKSFLWSEAHCFDEELFVGGISDCGVELNDGRYAVIDFKSAKEAYKTHAIQAAGYALQIERNGLWDEHGTINKKLEKPIDAIIIVPFGGKVEPVFFWNITDYKNAFKAAVTLYRLMFNQP